MQQSAPKLLLVEPESAGPASLRSMLEHASIRLIGPASDLGEVLDLAQRREPDVAVVACDLGSKLTGLDVARSLRGSRVIPILLVADAEEITRLPETLPPGVQVLSRPDSAEALRAAVQTLHDQSHQHRSAFEIEELSRAIFTGLLDPVIQLDSEGRILRASPQVFEWWETTSEQVIGQEIEKTLPMIYPETGAPIANVDHFLEPVFSGEKPMRVFVLDTPKRGRRHIEVRGISLRDSDGNTTGFLIHLHDFTRRHLLETGIQGIEKLGTLGQLAGGIAHDFNNLLGVISAYSELILTKLGEDHEVAPYVQSIAKSVQRGSKLIRTFNNISHPEREAAVSLVDLAKVTSEIVELLDRVLGRGIEIDFSYDDAQYAMLIDPVQLERVLVNLCMNAKDAMKGHGKVRIRLAVQSTDGQPDQAGKGPTRDCYVFTVEDEGCGMPEDVRLRIFEPFFTTKGKSGTGLGLAGVATTVNRYGGWIEVQSEPGKGSCFTIFFPKPQPGEALLLKR